MVGQRAALEGVRVVELSESISGPFCCKMLADMGAEVIKIENPGVGDVTRRLGPFPDDVPNPEKSGQFIYLNTNKKSITLDIYAASGRNILKELLRRADIIVESNPLQMMDGLDLGYNSLKEINPSLIVVSITPWGQTGPYRHYKAYDINISAASTLSYPEGLPELAPLQLPANQGGYYSGLTAAAATVLALYLRDIGYPAQQVDISQTRSFITHLMSISGFLIHQKINMRNGSRNQMIFPFHILPVKDGKALFLATIPPQWELVLRLLGNPEWATDPRFKDSYDLYKYADELESLTEEWRMSHTKSDIKKIARSTGTDRVAYPMETIEEVVHNEQLDYREFFVEVDHPCAGRVKMPGRPYKLSEAGAAIRSAAPLLGQHNVEVYCGELGYSKQDLLQLRASGII
jgi:crotonobetainyl-CoA:carnitine CoA-transferase CaiB-like acyl-CoA transferase